MKTRFTIIKVLSIILILATNYSCVSNADGKLIKRDLAKIDAKYQILENKVNDDQNKMKRVFKRVDVKLIEIEKTLKEARKLLQRNNADFGQDVVSIDLRVKKVEGKNEEVLFKFQQLEKKFKELQERISDVNGSIAITAGSNTNKDNNNTSDKNSNTNNSDKKDKDKNPDNKITKNTDYKKVNNPNALFKIAYSYIDKKNHKNLSHTERMNMAIEVFQHLINKYSKHKKANSARYWITQAYYSSNQYENAYRSLNSFLEKYPKSRHIPQILFQMGNSLKSLGLKKDSKTIFETLVKLYPKSGYSRQAKTILKKL